MKTARSTLRNARSAGVIIDHRTIGNSVQIWTMPDGSRQAMVLEGLGTEPLVPDLASIPEFDAKYWHAIGQSTVAVIANDMATAHVRPLAYLAYDAVRDGAWFENRVRSQALIEGRRDAVKKCGCAWVGGETPGLNGIIESGTIDLAGAMWGVCEHGPRRRRIESGDRILLFGSSGPHDNGFTDLRELAPKLPHGYRTEVAIGVTYADAILPATTLYVRLMLEIAQSGITIHGAENVTGHGLRKIMRADRDDLVYMIDRWFPMMPIYPFVQQHIGWSWKRMFGTFNCGAGFAVIAAKRWVNPIAEIARRLRIPFLDAGHVESGTRGVHIAPYDVSFAGDDLQLR